jgi:hypothetical protein
MKFRNKIQPKGLFGVVAFGGLVTQYFGSDYKEAEDCFYKSRTATDLYRMEGNTKVVMKHNGRRNNSAGAMALALGAAGL